MKSFHHCDLLLLYFFWNEFSTTLKVNSLSGWEAQVQVTGEVRQRCVRIVWPTPKREGEWGESWGCWGTFVMTNGWKTNELPTKRDIFASGFEVTKNIKLAFHQNYDFIFKGRGQEGFIRTESKTFFFITTVMTQRWTKWVVNTSFRVLWVSQVCMNDSLEMS